MIPQNVKKVVPYVATSTSGQERPYPAGSLLYPMKTKLQNIKEIYFCTELFKNTIFIMYEWWPFQWYCICLEKSEIRIGIEKLNFFLVHLGLDWSGKINLNKTKTRQQTQNLETKNRGLWASWCVRGIFEMLEFLNVCESFTLVLTKIDRHRTPSTEKNEGMQLWILNFFLTMHSYVSVRTKEQYCGLCAEFKSAIILNICLESEEMLYPLTHKKLHFVTQSSHIENSTQSWVCSPRRTTCLPRAIK